MNFGSAENYAPKDFTRTTPSSLAEPLSEIGFLKLSTATFRLVLSYTKSFSFVTLVSKSRKLGRQFTGVIGFRKVIGVTSDL